MTRSVELGLKLSEAREALMTLQTAAERDDGAITQALSGIGKLEIQWREATKAESDRGEVLRVRGRR